MDSGSEELTKDEAKARLLAERIATLEADNAGLRVELMAYSQEVERLNAQIKEYSENDKTNPVED